MSRDLVEILEAAYDVEQGEGTWLRGVLGAVLPSVDAGLGTIGYFVDASGDGFRAWGVEAVGGAAGRAGESFREWDRVTPAAFKRHVHTFAPCGISDEIPIPQAWRDDLRSANDSHGWPRLFGINALDARARGCAIATPLPDGAAPALDRPLWRRIATHVATGARLRAKLAHTGQAGTDGAAAVLSPAARVAHLEGDAQGVRDALRTAVRGIERARSKAGRKDGENALALWQNLVAGRFTLVDAFERDGRRYILARANRPHAADAAAAAPANLDALTPRERELLGAAALGHANKLIAYELGVSPSTVAMGLSRAAKKLGAHTRVEAIQRYIAATTAAASSTREEE